MCVAAGSNFRDETKAGTSGWNKEELRYPFTILELVVEAVSVPNRPVRTGGPWRPIVPSVPGGVGMDGEARRPSSILTAGL